MSDSVRSVASSVLNPYALVSRPLASDVVHATGTLDDSCATDTICVSQGEVTLIDVSDSNSVNVPTPPEVIATSNVSPTLTYVPAQASSMPYVLILTIIIKLIRVSGVRPRSSTVPLVDPSL